MTTLYNESLQLVYETLFLSRIYILPTNIEKEISISWPEKCLRHHWKNPPKCRKTAEEKTIYSDSAMKSILVILKVCERGTQSRQDGEKIVLNTSESAMNCCSLLLQGQRGLCKSTVLPTASLPYSISPSFVIADRRNLTASPSRHPCGELHSCHIALKLIPAIRHSFPFLHLLHQQHSRF